jgi:hypothetical protein
MISGSRAALARTVSPRARTPSGGAKKCASRVEGTSAGSSPMLVSGTSPPAYDSGTSERSSAPRRSALNCEFTLTSDEFG